MTKKYPKLKNMKVRELDSEVQDQRDILAIVEGCFGVPVKRSGRFINVNHPPDDATKEELEAIKRFWSDPDDFVSLRDLNIKPLPKRAKKADVI